MPFRSQRQRRMMFARMPQTAQRWARHTKNVKRLPERKNNQKQQQKRSK